MSTWFLEVDGVKRSLKAWSMTSAKLTIISQVADTLSFTAAASLKIPFETKVVLWLDTERRFTGLVTETKFEGAASGDRRSYTVSGPWWYLEKIVYQQPRWVLVDAFDPSKGYTQKATSMAVLFQGDDGGSILAGVQARAAVDYAIAKGAPIARASSFALDAGVPWEKGLDLSCAEIVTRCTRWTRDAAVWWDYSPEVPVLHIGRRSSLDVVTLDLADADTVLQLTPAPRHDIQVRAVRIIFLKIEVNDDGDQWLNPIAQDAGPFDGGIRNLVFTLQLSGQGKSTEPIPSGLALSFYNSVKDLQWQGTISINLVGASGSMGPGNTLNLDSGDDEWSEMIALVQSIEEDLFTGATRIEFGPPDQLGLQDFQELINFRRGGTTAGQDGGSRNDGRPPTPTPPTPPNTPPPSPPSGPPSGPGNGIGFFKIKVCDGGAEREILVAGGGSG